MPLVQNLGSGLDTLVRVVGAINSALDVLSRDLETQTKELVRAVDEMPRRLSIVTTELSSATTSLTAVRTAEASRAEELRSSLSRLHDQESEALGHLDTTMVAFIDSVEHLQSASTTAGNRIVQGIDECGRSFEQLHDASTQGEATLGTAKDFSANLREETDASLREIAKHLEEKINVLCAHMEKLTTATHDESERVTKSIHTMRAEIDNGLSEKLRTSLHDFGNRWAANLASHRDKAQTKSVELSERFAADVRTLMARIDSEMAQPARDAWTTRAKPALTNTSNQAARMSLTAEKTATYLQKEHDPMYAAVQELFIALRAMVNRL